ncbi:MAG TPA: GDSL-type esterase/lipase family protein [Sphingobacteriaceae bacterium]
MKILKYIMFSVLLAGLTATVQAQNKWESAIRNFEKQDSSARPAPGGILFTGSSSIAKWTDIQSYFPGYRVINRGFGGSEFSDLLYYADRVIMPYKPSKIFIYEGDNDLAAGKKVPEIMQQARDLREKIGKALPGVPVAFISAKPSIARWELREAYESLNAELKKYAEATLLTMYADVWTPMLDRSGKPLPLFVQDNLHMTPEGYRIWQKVMLDLLPAGRKD